MIYGEVTQAFPMAVASAVEALATTSSRKVGVGFCLDYLP